MRRYAWIGGAFIIVVLLVAAEVAIIANAAGLNVKRKAVFAKERIEKNTVITENMVEVREISKDAIHPQALKDVAEALAMTAVTDLEAGEMLLGPKLSDNIRSVIEARDADKRLYSVEFRTDQANAWQMTDNQYVDVIFVPSCAAAQDQPPWSSSAMSTNTSDTGSANVGAADTGASNINAADTGTANTGVTNISASDINAADINTANINAADALPVLNGITVLKRIRIAGIIDEKGKLVNILEPECLPRYISLELTQEQAIFLAYAKGNGRIELSCIPGK